MPACRKARARELGIEFGVLKTGTFNAITDVKGLTVGQVTLKVFVSTIGVSMLPNSLTCGKPAILPKPFARKIPAGTLFLKMLFG